MASRNRVEAIIAYFHKYGLIHRRAVADDRRLSVLVATAKMWAFQTELFLAYQTAQAMLAEQPDLASAYESQGCAAEGPSTAKFRHQAARSPASRTFEPTDSRCGVSQSCGAEPALWCRCIINHHLTLGVVENAASGRQQK